MGSTQVGELLRQAPEGLGATPGLGLSSKGSEEPWEGFTRGMTWSSPALGAEIYSSEKQNLNGERELAFSYINQYTLRPEHLNHAKVPPTGSLSNGSLAAGLGTGSSRGTGGHSEPCHPGAS